MPSIVYAVPLAGIVSLVYCSTRFELPAKIFQSATVMFIKTVVGLAVLYGLLYWLSS